MPVHSFHIFDRKGKTLFTKTYMKDQEEDPIQQGEQRKLVFGMLFSLGQITANLSPKPGAKLHSIQTGASILHTYESNSGMRIALYTTPNEKATTIQPSLEYIFNELWINCVIRSPLYNPLEPTVTDTNFEEKLDEYLGQQTWFN